MTFIGRNLSVHTHTYTNVQSPDSIPLSTLTGEEGPTGGRIKVYTSVQTRRLGRPDGSTDPLRTLTLVIMFSVYGSLSSQVCSLTVPVEPVQRRDPEIKGRVVYCFPSLWEKKCNVIVETILDEVVRVPLYDDCQVGREGSETNDSCTRPLTSLGP